MTGTRCKNLIQIKERADSDRQREPQLAARMESIWFEPKILDMSTDEGELIVVQGIARTALLTAMDGDRWWLWQEN